MDEAQVQIVSYSDKVITKLQLLSVFFEEELIYKIYIRTQVIHKLFKSNPELDIHKLQLFHVQFTESIIELLKKVKKGNEKKLLQTSDEIQVNGDLIQKLTDSMHLQESFEHAREGHTSLINEALYKLYQNLSDYSKENPFQGAIKQFSNLYAKDFFYEVIPEFIDRLLQFEPGHVYKNGYGVIQKKLMGLQCKHGFKNVFYCGLRAGDKVVEIYRFADFIMEEDDDEYFVFHPARNLALGCPFSTIKGIDINGGVSKKAKIILDLSERNVQLKNSMPFIKTDLPAEVALLLADYYRRIESINFLDLIDDFDIQANILKTMLNTDSI